MKHYEVEYIHLDGFHISTRSVTFRTLRAACRWIRKHENASPVRINYIRKDMYKPHRTSRMQIYILRADGHWGNPDTRRYPKYLDLKTGKQVDQAPPRR